MAQEFPYLALVVGLITGIVVRSAAASGESIGRGAMAAVVALAACAGAPFAKMAYMQNQTKDADKPQQVAEADKSADDEEAGDEEGDAEESDEPEVEVAAREAVAAPADKLKIKMEAPSKDKDDIMSLVWLSGASILAYVVGKGGTAAAAQSSEESAPAEPEGGEEPQQGDA